MTKYDESWRWVEQKKYMHMALVLITVTMNLQFQMKGCVGCLETERMGLLQLKSYLNSIWPRPILESWIYDDSKGDCCHWEGVKCSDAIGGHIVNLSLNMGIWSLNLSLLHSFPQLKTLDLMNTGLTDLFDPIYGYKSFQRLENLVTLMLAGNNLNKSVLPFLSAARSLRSLDLGYNQFGGAFSLNDLINFRELEKLSLRGNSINDFEAGDGLRTTKLKKLNLGENNFSENARLKGFEQLLELEYLSMENNYLRGAISIHSVVFPSSLQVLDLKNNQLSLTHEGYSEICKLRYLEELDLRFNALTIMPKCLGNLTGLRTLDLSENQMSGNLSSFVSSLPSNLEYLSLLHNNFNGSSFSFNSLVHLTKLTVFRVSSNDGMIQAQAESSWIPLFQLKMLKLQNFNLGSTIPGFLIYQHDMCSIDISYSNLTGAFPAWLVQNNTRLQTIFLNSNSLKEFQLPRRGHGLLLLDISSNQIYGSIQEDIGMVFPNLAYMNLASNRFQGTIPSSIGEMKGLQVLDMSSNGLSGQLPKTFLSSCYMLKFLKLSNNQLEGSIFPEHANLTGLAWLYLGGNKFNGSLGKGLLNSKELRLLDLSDNCFSGSLPLWIDRISNLGHLYMKGNQLKGRFPGQLQNIALKVIDISQNRFFGSIPRNVEFPFLRELRLHSNEFVGSIPDTLFKTKELVVLDLRNNKFSGKIMMNTTVQTTELAVLLLRNNSLQGHISKKLCHLSKVGFLDLSHNKFKGPIPSCFSNMSFGEYSYEVNFRSGDNFVDTTLLQQCDYRSKIHSIDQDQRVDMQLNPIITVNFVTKKRYEAYQGDILSLMYGLDLSNNQLSGKIPVEIGDLEKIRSLNLSSNDLTGPIPTSISRLHELESLDLSNNKLDGNIPFQIANLNNLGSFNVSCNHLSGEIPFKGHLGTFDERSYLGNAHLCGLPTNKSCNPTIVPELKHEEEKEVGDGVIDMVWFYWTCGAVYIFTSLALFAFLWIDSRWSREWFYRVDLFIHHLQRLKRRFICI